MRSWMARQRGVRELWLQRSRQRARDKDKLWCAVVFYNVQMHKSTSVGTA